MKDLKRVCRIKEIMCNANISSDKMREMLGISIGQMHKLEFGLTVDSTVIRKVSDTFNVPLEELM